MVRDDREPGPASEEIAEVLRRDLRGSVEIVLQGARGCEYVGRDGVAPAPDVGDRVVRITGRAKLDGLLAGEEAVRLQLVAGARFELWKRPLMFEFSLSY